MLTETLKGKTLEEVAHLSHDVVLENVGHRDQPDPHEVRDAGPQGRQERRAGRNRHLARRSGNLSADVLRVAAAIVVDACAFSLWNLASRSPARLLRDIAAGARHGRPSRCAAPLRFVAGLLLLLAGAVLLLPLAIGPHTLPCSRRGRC